MQAAWANLRMQISDQERLEREAFVSGHAGSSLFECMAILVNW